MRRLLISLFALFSVSVAAQQPPAAERGFKPDLMYDFKGFDTVNLFNGNLIAAIPLGPVYPVGEGLSYSFTLRYSGNLWKESQTCAPLDPGNCTVRYLTQGSDNSGFGWAVSFGKLEGPSTTDTSDPYSGALLWRYVSPDGGEHLFFDTLHEPKCSATITTNCDSAATGVRYTRDGSYLRLKDLGTAYRLLEFPDGTRELYDATYNRILYRFTASSTVDATGVPTTNFVKFDYSTTGYYTVSDSLGRTHKVHLTGSLVDKVELAAFAGSTATNTATYDLVHGTRTIKRRCGFASDPTVTSSIAFLDSLSLPSGESWAFTYDEPATACSETSGTMKTAILPTKGKLAWTWTTVSFPSGDVPSVAVAERTTYASATATTPLTRLVYTRPVEGTVVATNYDPALNAALSKTHHYHQAQNLDWFGLPYTTASRTGAVPNPDGSAAGRYLSSETFACDPATSTCSATADRATYVKYELDTMQSGCPVGSPCRQERNRRVVAERTLYVSDGGRVADVAYSRFDGLGHYRQSDTAGTFDSGNVRSQSTEYNGWAGNYQLDASGNRLSGYTVLTATNPWLLETFTSASVTEGGVTQTRQACFSSTTGLLLRDRVMAATATGANDLLTVYTRNGAGFVTREQRYGGDKQTIDLGSLCTMPLPATDAARTDNTWSAGVLATSRPVTSSGTNMSFFSADRTLDANTGLVSISRDTAGLATTYTYDSMGRLRWEKPASDGWTEYVFTAATTAAPAQVELREWNQGGTVLMGKSQWFFDPFGRVAKERRLMPDNLTWSTRTYRYNALGLRDFVSEAEGVDAPVNGTTYRKFDPYGRPAEIVAADGKITSFLHRGVRQVERTTQVKTSTSATLAPSTTTETYDRQGRLWRVTEPSGASGALVTTEYTYDQGGRLKRVMTAAAEGTQNRYFTYDGRGLLLSEQHPEKGTSGNGTVTYGLYDATGQAGKRVDGPFDVRYTYDRAGRLTLVQEGTGRIWKTFTYATANTTTPEGQTDWRNGKLLEALRHNYLDRFAMDITMKETYTYAGVGGRVSRRNTVSSDVTSFTQTFAYDDRGRVTSLGYPSCTADCTLAGPSITNTYTNGALTAVSSFAPSITYHSNYTVNDVTFANAAHWIQDKDPYSMSRPARFRTTNTGANWDSGAYGYDGAGNITAIGLDSYYYDKVGRILYGTAQNGVASQAYTYDTFGNLKSIGTTRSGVTTPRTISASAATNRLTTETYDAAGNVSSFAGKTYEYDPLGMVRAMHDAAYATDWVYLYTADDERIWSFDVAANTSFWRVRDLGGKVLSEFINASDVWSGPTSYAYRDGALLGAYSPSRAQQYTFFALDHLGTPRQTLSSTRSVLATHAYFPFGEEATNPTLDGEVMKFTGHERDLCCDGVNTPVDYMHARYYGPTMGRFLSVDPVLDIDAALKNPQRWNRYTYVANTPIRYIDPDGREMTLSDYASAVWEATKQTADDVGFIVAYPALKMMQGFVTGEIRPVAEGFSMIAMDATIGVGASAAVSRITMGFTSRTNLLTHFRKHGGELGFKFAEQYGAAARRFVGTAGTEGVQTIVTKAGDRLIYNAATREFAVVNKAGKIVSYFKAGGKYWRAQLRQGVDEAGQAVAK